MARIDTLIVARDPLFREGFAQTLGTSFAVVAAESLDQAFGEIKRGLRPRLLIIEVAAVDFGVLHEIHLEVPAVKTVVLMDSDQAMPFAALTQCDIDGCIPTDMQPETLRLSLGLIMAGQTVMSRKLATAMYGGRTAALQRNARHFLTPRECDVLRLLSLGHSSKEIARELGISVASVKVDLNVLLGKLDVRNRTEAAVWAIGQLDGSIGPSRRCTKVAAMTRTRTQHGRKGASTLVACRSATPSD